MTTFAAPMHIHLSKRIYMAKKMIGDEGFRFTEEFKVNVVYLLATRYEGNIDKCSNGILVNKLLLAKWKEDLMPYVRDLLPNQEEESTSEDIFKKGMRRLKSVISTSKDPQKITSALKMMREMDKENNTKDEESIFDTINAMILGEDIDNEE